MALEQRVWLQLNDCLPPGSREHEDHFLHRQAGHREAQGPRVGVGLAGVSQLRLGLLPTGFDEVAFPVDHRDGLALTDEQVDAAHLKVLVNLDGEWHLAVHLVGGNRTGDGVVNADEFLRVLYQIGGMADDYDDELKREFGGRRAIEADDADIDTLAGEAAIQLRGIRGMTPKKRSCPLCGQPSQRVGEPCDGCGRPVTDKSLTDMASGTREAGFTNNPRKQEREPGTGRRTI